MLKSILFLAFLVFFCPSLFCAEPIVLSMTIAVGGKILVNVSVNGETISCIVDTGSPYFLLLDQVLADQMGLSKTKVRLPLRFFAEDQGGKTYRVTIPYLKIGSFQYENVPALTIDNIFRITGNTATASSEFWAQGILGMAFLQDYRVIVDYPHSRLLLYPPEGRVDYKSPAFSSPLIPMVAINGSIPFLLDTGSTFSVISKDAVSMLGLNFTPTVGDSLFKGVVQANNLSIGDTLLPSANFEVADHFSEYASGNFQGILGYDLLQNFVLDLNFPENQIKLKNP